MPPPIPADQAFIGDRRGRRRYEQGSCAHCSVSSVSRSTTSKSSSRLSTSETTASRTRVSRSISSRSVPFCAGHRPVGNGTAVEHEMSAHQSASRRSRRSRMSQATAVALRPVAKACARNRTKASAGSTQAGPPASRWPDSPRPATMCSARPRNRCRGQQPWPVNPLRGDPATASGPARPPPTHRPAARHPTTPGCTQNRSKAPVVVLNDRHQEAAGQCALGQQTGAIVWNPRGDR